MQDDSQPHTSRPLLADAKLPRFTQLPLFDPHRQSFECKHEADANPPITPEAEALFQQALVATNNDLWPEDRDYAKAVQLYEQAMKLGHWKAQFNLAGLYLKGWGVPQSSGKAVLLTEDLMSKGVPAAWDNMGTMYMGGLGSLKQDATVAYAFWQRAADMGSMAAQTYIGAKLLGNHDEPPSFWGNREIGLKMLECAFAQGYGEAAYELGATLNVGEEDYARALSVLHEGVKFGSEKSAGYLSSSFSLNDKLVGGIGIANAARSERYMVLADALYTNPDLRFPNLDKVLPLPPAALPKWDGNKQTLIDAAKAVVPIPPKPPKPQPLPQRTGRAHIPEGFVLPEKPQRHEGYEVMAQAETTSAPVSGYWIAKLLRPSTDRHRAWDAAQLPLRYDKGESFDRTRPGLVPEDGRIYFHYLGQLVPAPVIPPIPANPYVAQGVAREADLPLPAQQCSGDERCPQTGIWSASVSADHPMAKGFNQWHRQSYVEQGQPFPDPRNVHLNIEPDQITWLWWNQANAEHPKDITHVGLGNPARRG